MIGTILQLLPLALAAWVLGRASGERHQRRSRHLLDALTKAGIGCDKGGQSC
ncbi:MAG: hypothetical protein R3F17_14250 [Planctomycetota bacterium]